MWDGGEVKMKIDISDRQIKWLCRIFPISTYIGPVGIFLNIILYAVIIAFIFSRM